MPITESITFVVLVNDEEVYKNNFLSSPFFAEGHIHEILAMRNCSSASRGYNAGIQSAKNDLMVFAHQDLFLPRTWVSDLWNAITYLDSIKMNWGVLGCFGSAKDKHGGVGKVYTTGIGMHGKEIVKPEHVETLDEIVLVVRKSSGLKFDTSLPHFHLYGADICMAAREKGMTCCVIPAFCVHNTTQLVHLPKEFYSCYRYIKRKWGKYLPIYTSCIKISRFDNEFYIREMKEMYRRILRREIRGKCRAEDPRAIL